MDNDRDNVHGDSTSPRVGRDRDNRADADPVLYSADVSGSAATLPSGAAPSHPRRLNGPARVAVVAGAAVVIAWIPSFIATAYTVEPASASLANPARGWAFLWESVTASRNPRLGTADAAMQEADRVWAGRPAVAEDVTLKNIPSPWTIPVPAGGTVPAPGRGVVTPTDELQWWVQGRVNGGPQQVIGLLDYRTGRVEWDIRPLATTEPR